MHRALSWKSPCWIQQHKIVGQRWDTSSLLTAGYQNSSITRGNYNNTLIHKTLKVGHTNINEQSKRNISLIPHLTICVKAIQHQTELSFSAWSLPPEPCRLSCQVTVGFISFHSVPMKSFWCGIHTQVSRLMISQVTGINQHHKHWAGVGGGGIQIRKHV